MENVVNNSIEFPEYLLHDAPGLPGQIANWINSMSIRRQPILALGAAICASGTIFAHRIRSDTDLRTNFMVLSIAESGCGKEGARQLLNKLFSMCGISHYILGEFVSDAGMLSALKKNGIGFAMTDEIGREINALFNGTPSNHEQRIITTMMKLFSQASGTYRGKQYANHDGKTPRVDIEQPCLNLYGTTVPKRLFDSLTSDDAIDGFLPRWLLFNSSDINPPRQKLNNNAQKPTDLIKAIATIQAIPVYDNSTPAGTKTIPTPKIIPFSDSAEIILDDLEGICNEKRVQEIKDGGLLAPIWARTREHAIKLALVSHNFERGVIEDDVMQWACDLALYLSEFSIRAIRENISDSENEKVLRRVHGIIKRYNDNNQNKGMPNKIFVQRMGFLTPNDRNKIVTQLAESEYIEKRKTGKIYAGQPCYAFYAKEYDP